MINFYVNSVLIKLLNGINLLFRRKVKSFAAGVCCLLLTVMERECLYDDFKEGDVPRKFHGCTSRDALTREASICVSALTQERAGVPTEDTFF